MSDFPTLSSTPLVAGYQQGRALDSTVRSTKEGGYVQTRPRFTRSPRKFHLVYGDLSNTDQAALESHEDGQKMGADSFSWTNPQTSVTYTVRYGEGGIKFGINEETQLNTAEFDLEEV